MVLNYHKEIFSTYIFKTAFCYTGTVQKINNNTGVVSNYAGQGIQILSFSKVNYKKIIKVNLSVCPLMKLLIQDMADPTDWQTI